MLVPQGSAPKEGPGELQVSGTPPEAFAAIRQKRLAAQPSDSPHAGGFGIPVDVCESLTGFRYDNLDTVTEPYIHLFMCVGDFYW
ncbi:hypothetical protein LZ198_16840 [Myxococcus sp. K15C18031901]|uniref:hypothetical protein n=1 Tax=Myxococcus dinghuensis TaxID=2906761 RepID=UPI0020A6F842|nr:hypothetical protein [Myxococcus dinghuensis]MCP3100538.1 hypothetical protein [Myxococcus dinghuensis]